VGGSRSARARQAQAFVDTYKAAFERDFRLGGAEGSGAGASAAAPLSLQEVRACVCVSIYVMYVMCYGAEVVRGAFGRDDDQCTISSSQLLLAN